MNPKPELIMNHAQLIIQRMQPIHEKLLLFYHAGKEGLMKVKSQLAILKNSNHPILRDSTSLKRGESKLIRGPNLPSLGRLFTINCYYYYSIMRGKECLMKVKWQLAIL